MLFVVGHVEACLGNPFQHPLPALASIASAKHEQLIGQTPGEGKGVEYHLPPYLYYTSTYSVV